MSLNLARVGLTKSVLDTWTLLENKSLILPSSRSPLFLTLELEMICFLIWKVVQGWGQGDLSFPLKKVEHLGMWPETICISLNLKSYLISSIFSALWLFQNHWWARSGEGLPVHKCSSCNAHRNRYKKQSFCLDMSNNFCLNRLPQIRFCLFRQSISL